MSSSAAWLGIGEYRYCCRRQAATRASAPVLFLNGAFQSMDSWQPFVSHFERLTTARPTFPDRVESLALGGVMKQIPPAHVGRTAGTIDLLGSGRTAEFAGEVVDGLLCADAEGRIERSRVAARVLMT